MLNLTKNQGNTIGFLSFANNLMKVGFKKVVIIK